MNPSKPSPSQSPAQSPAQSPVQSADQESVARREYTSPIGTLELVASASGLRAVLLPEERPDRIRLPETIAEGEDAETAEHHLQTTATELDEYFAGTRTEFSVALAPVGTEFQLRAWNALREIPYGTTQSYGGQAHRMNQPSAVRAVGAANGKNPLSIVVPCHRVVGADGSLTGYAGGVAAKQFLLALEGTNSRLPECNVE